MGIQMVIIIHLLLAILPAKIANSKGYSAVGYYFFGLLFFLPALIVVLCVEDRNEVAQRETMYQNNLNNLQEKVADLENRTSTLPKLAVHPANPDVEPDSPLLRRAFLSLEDGDWEKADEILEQLLDMEPENAKAYIGKLCVQLRLHREAELIDYEQPIVDLPNYKRALQSADIKYKHTLELYALTEEQKARHTV